MAWDKTLPLEERRRLIREQYFAEQGAKLGAKAAKTAGALNSALFCPHCQTPGQVRTKPETVKAGLSGGKVVAAVFTGGLSMITPGVGLSRKAHMTRATCGACRSTWLF